MRLNMSRCTKKGWMASQKYVQDFFKVIYLHSVHWGVESATKFWKKRGLTGSQFLERGCCKRGGDFLEQGDGGIAVFT